MYEDGEGQRSILFHVSKGDNIYSIPIQNVTRVEHLMGKISTVSRSENYIVGVCRLCGRNINIVDLGRLLDAEHTSDSKSSTQILLVMANADVGFLVESVLGIETLCSRQSPGALSNQLVKNVYLCDEHKELILELDVPRLLAIC